MLNHDDLHTKIGQNCILALQEEIDTTPKPGLVDTLNSGAHKDMDYSTFIASIKAIGPYFASFAKIGAECKTIDHITLDLLRPLGLQCERTMYEATGGINTHKGAIFSLGILAVSAGYCESNFKKMSIKNLCEIAQTMGQASLKDFEKTMDNKKVSSGQRIYNEYGIKGVRGEVASGFKSVRKHALPVMNSLFNKNLYKKNDIYVQVLLHLMSNVIDTNIIAREGLDAIEFVQNSAAEVLKFGGAFTQQGRKKLLELDREFINRNISPGGCADLLSVAIFLYNIAV